MTVSTHKEWLPDEAALLELGARLAVACPGEATIHLHGELGAGKTTLVRGILRALGHLGPVKSPTYTLVEPYQIAGHQIYHFDLYRIGTPEELESMGGRDYFGARALRLIEWPERGAGWLPAPDLEVFLDYADGGRAARLEACSPIGKQILGALVVPDDSRDPA